jgi:hypothetical protein
MKIHQLSLFLENRSGQLRNACKILADAGINLATLSLADTEQFGILRLIVRDWQKAKQVLEDAGRLVKVTEVVAIEVPDRPGGMAEILDVIDEKGLFIEYMYAFSASPRQKAILIFRFEKTDEAIQTLKEKGINLVGSLELFEGLD